MDVLEMFGLRVLILTENGEENRVHKEHRGNGI